MVLVLVVPTYDADSDELTLRFATAPVAKEVNHNRYIQATYSEDDQLLSLTLRKVRAEAPELLQTALRLIDKVGLDAVDAAIPLTVAVLLEYFDVVPDLATLSLPWDGEVGYLTEYVARQLLDPAAADRVIQALAYFKPLTPGTGHPDPLGNAWRFLPHYQPTLPAELELLRVPAFRASMGAVLGAVATKGPGNALAELAMPDTEFYALAAAAGYDTPRSLPKKTEAKLRRLIQLVRSQTQNELSGTTHVTPAGGNVFSDLGFPPEEAEQLLAESDARIAKAPGKSSYLARLRAAAEQLTALATAKTAAYRQAQLASIDWALVADEFESVVGRYECSIERYAGQIIRSLAQQTICYRDCVELHLALADLEAHLEDCEPDHDFDQDVAEAWEESVDALDIKRGLVRAMPPIQTLAQLRLATDEKLAAHRRLDQASVAYRSGWSLPYTKKAVEEVLHVATLATGARITILVAHCAPTWLPTEQVLNRAVCAMSLSGCDAVLAELASAIDAAAEAGYIEIRGAADSWQASELRLK